MLNSVNLCLQSGFMYSDFVTTVSPTYAKEVLTPEVWKLSYKNLQNCLLHPLQHLWMHQCEISRHTCNNDILIVFQKGEGLQSTIEALPKFQGILNGIDDKVWNPATDSFLRHHYSTANLKGKQLIKNGLRRRLRMAYEGVDAKRPLVSEYIEKISL